MESFFTDANETRCFETWVNDASRESTFVIIDLIIIYGTRFVVNFTHTISHVFHRLEMLTMETSPEDR